MSDLQSQPAIGCEEFQDKLPELFESGRPIDSEEHLKGCEQCSSLVRDLQYIAAQAKLLLPLHDPSPSVWEKIESKLSK